MLNKIIRAAARFIPAAAIMCAFFVSMIPAAYADTDGNELKTTGQPDKLILRLGAGMAGAEFELRLDSGVFPVPVVADSSGVLTMELGGSKTYTLTLRAPADVSEPSSGEGSFPVADKEPADPEPDSPLEIAIPPLRLVLFVTGLIVCAGVLVIMRVMKKRREYYGDDDDYGGDDE